MADQERKHTPAPQAGSEAEEQDQTIELIDEQGQHVLFDHLATLEYEGESYLVLAPTEEAENEDEDAELNVAILKIQQQENAEDDLYLPPTEKEEEAVFELFLKMMDEMEEEEN